MNQERIRPPHVLIFPLPVQGPVNCMLKLAEILCLSTDLHVTFLNTQHVQSCLFSHTDVQSRFNRYPNFRFETISDGLPLENPRTAHHFREMIRSMEVVTKQLFKDLLLSYGPSCSGLNSQRPMITCIIADGFFNFVLDIAKEVGIPLIFMETISPCSLWIYFRLPTLIQDFDPTSFKDDMDAPITSVPGMENFLRGRDLPSFLRSQDANDPVIQRLLTEVQQIPQAKGLILNTFHELDGPLISHIQTMCPNLNLYSIGPLHAHLKIRKSSQIKTSPPQVTSFPSNSLWEENRNCIAWLDAQPVRSVVYVSIGSLAMMTGDQVMEFWHGLVNSKSRFLWVRRPGSITGLDEESGQIPVELQEGTRERGCIVSWVPQEEVLSHPAIGGFLTHSGWNSTLESITEGVPMVCWPYFADQQVNSRFVGEVWKLGIDMKDQCDRITVEKTIRDLTELRRDEFLKTAGYMAKLARKSVSEDGSSYCNLDLLIEDIRLMSVY